MPFPKTESELAEQGYQFESFGCCSSRACNAQIAWYRTPKDKRIPLNRETLEPHWSTCPNASAFRKGKR